MAKKRGFSKSIISFLMMVPTIFSAVKNLISLMGYEARISIRSMVTIIILSILVAALLFTTWLGLLGLLFVYLIKIPWSPEFSLFVIILINLFLLFISGFAMCRVRKRIFFPVTRYQLKKIRRDIL